MAARFIRAVASRLANTAHSRSVFAARPSFTVAAPGARIGNHTSYQFPDACLPFGTPRGGCRTVPMRKPSPRNLGVPRRTIRAVIDVAHKPTSRWVKPACEDRPRCAWS